MKQAALIGIVAFSVLLIGCNNQPEETPDITEAIPVEDEAGLDGAADQAGGESGGGNDQVEAYPSPVAPSTTAPPTMESGSNSPGTDIELEGSKLQRADPK